LQRAVREQTRAFLVTACNIPAWALVGLAQK